MKIARELGSALPKVGLRVDPNAASSVPTGPGLGVEADEEKLAF